MTWICWLPLLMRHRQCDQTFHWQTDGTGVFTFKQQIKGTQCTVNWWKSGLLHNVWDSDCIYTFFKHLSPGTLAVQATLSYNSSHVCKCGKLHITWCKQWNRKRGDNRKHSEWKFNGTAERAGSKIMKPLTQQLNREKQSFGHKGQMAAQSAVKTRTTSVPHHEPTVPPPLLLLIYWLRSLLFLFVWLVASISCVTGMKMCHLLTSRLYRSTDMDAFSIWTFVFQLWQGKPQKHATWTTCVLPI